jgi:hypothetical protein
MIKWSTSQWHEDLRTQVAIEEARRRANAEKRPTVGRTWDPSGRDDLLGVRGPLTQHEGIKQAGEPRSLPWRFECGCGWSQIVHYDKLAKIVRATLAHGEHDLTLT